MDLTRVAEDPASFVSRERRTDPWRPCAFAARMLSLQRSVGNAAVGRLIRGGTDARRRVLARQLGGVSIASQGFDDQPGEVLRFFRMAYDADHHLRRAEAALEQFTGGTRELSELRAQFRTRYRGHFERLRDAGDRGSLARSLETMAGVERRADMPLAASFVIGFRESGRNLTRAEAIEDSFWQSGLDHLYAIQSTLRGEGLLPRDLRFAQGTNYGDRNPEAPGVIESARIEARDVFLAHSAYISHAGRRFEDLAEAYGYGEADIAALSDMQRNFWTALTFAGPGGAEWNSGLRGYGAITVLSYMRDHGLALGDIAGILEMNPFGRRRRTRIAVRTAAIISGLESMMRDYADARHTEQAAILEHGTELDIMGAYSTAE